MRKNASKKPTLPESFIGPFDAKIDAVAREKLITARVALLIKSAFFGNLVTRMKLVNADETIETIATDGRTFYYNSRFVNALSSGEVQFGFAHEILHVVYDHFGRRESRDHRLANVAADYCVNADLKKHNVGTFITTVPCLYDPKYEGWSFEQVYDDLASKSSSLDIDNLLEKLLDEHLEVADGDAQREGERPVISRQDAQEIQDELKEAIVSAYQTCNNTDSVPSNVQRIIRDITEPKLNWRELLRAHIESSIKSDYTWTRPSRKGWHSDAILPGTIGSEAISLVVAIDTSGSVNNAMLRDFLGEIVGITESFPEFTLRIFTFDTAIYNPVVFTNDDINDLASYPIHGGGGTDFRAIFNYLKSEEVVPDKLIVFTDLECSTFGDPNYADTLWVVYSQSQSYQVGDAPFGQTVRFDHQ
jgi:predicted metal-dependent peptidase